MRDGFIQTQEATWSSEHKLVPLTAPPPVSIQSLLHPTSELQAPGSQERLRIRVTHSPGEPEQPDSRITCVLSPAQVVHRLLSPLKS